MPIHASVAGWFTAEVTENGELIAVVALNFAKSQNSLVLSFFPFSLEKRIG